MKRNLLINTITHQRGAFHICRESNLHSWVAEPGTLSSSSPDRLHGSVERRARQRRPGRGCRGSEPGPGSSLGSGSGGWALHLSLCSTGPHSL